MQQYPHGTGVDPDRDQSYNYNPETDEDKKAAEDQAFEQYQHGTGVDPDMDQSYRYNPEDDDNGAVKTGYQDASLSGQFTGDESDPYASQFGGQQYGYSADESAVPDDGYNNDLSNEFTDDDSTDPYTNQFGEDREEQDDEEQEPGEDTEQEEGEGSRQESGPMGRPSGGKKKVNWKEGDKITIKLLEQVWNKASSIPAVKPFIVAANEAVTNTLMATPPVYGTAASIILKIYGKSKAMLGDKDDIIGDMLKIISNTNTQTTMSIMAVGQALITQQWAAPATVKMLPSILETVMNIPPVSTLLGKIFAIAVPVINGVSK